MISVGEARDILEKNGKALTPIVVPLHKAVGLVLAEDVFAAVDVPGFNQSAMDGYAFRFDDWQENEKLTLAGMVQAGSVLESELKPKQAVRIFTGAAVPNETDTVVMQEKVVIEDNKLLINDPLLKKGGNVRLRGSEINKYDLALPKDTKLTPAGIGFLAGIGIKEVLVYPLPRIKLVITGNELVQPGLPLQNGQVYESNSFALSAVLQQMGVQELSISFAKDNIEELKAVIEAALQEVDVLLITGGVSVGDYDFVANALVNCGVEKLFHKIKQKPGKPLFAGKRNDQFIFGLPGNPSSVLTCFYEYVVPTMAQMMNAKTSIIQKINLPLRSFYSKNAGLTHFLKGHCANGKVTLLTGQESYKLNSFATANCLVCLAEEGTHYHAGDIVEVHLF